MADDDSNHDNRPIELELDLPSDTDALPAWVATILVAIGAIVPLPYAVAFAALEALVVPLRTDGRWAALPEGLKARVRTVKDAKLAGMRAARDAAPVPTPDVAPTARQAIPVVREAPPTASIVQEPRSGSWARIPSGPDRGTWGARIEHAPSDPLRTGTLVRLHSRNGNRVSHHVITTIVRTDGFTTIGTVREATAVDMGPRTGTTPANGVSVAPIAPTTPLVIVASTPSVEIDSSLASIAEQSVASSAPSTLVEPTTSGNGLQSAADASGTAYTPTGPTVFEARRIEQGLSPEARLPAPRALRATPSTTANDVRRLLGERDMIAGAVASGSMLQVSWVGGGTTTLGKVRDTLESIGRADDAPGGPSTERHAGRAVESLKGRDLDTTRLPTRDLPAGVKSRWLIGRKLSGAAINAGDAYGTALLIVDLRDDDTLAFDGDLNLASAVRSHYATATAKETLRSEDLTSWLGSLLKRRHGAVKRGPVWYVPGGQADAARALSEAIAPLWGDHERIPVTTGPDLMRSLTRGLTDEVGAVAKDLTLATETARERAISKATDAAKEHHGATADYIAQQGEIAGRRATVSPTVAARLLTDLVKVAGRVAGYETMLGTDAVSVAKAQIATLRATLEPLTDDASARAAMLELV